MARCSLKQLQTLTTEYIARAAGTRMASGLNLPMKTSEYTVTTGNGEESVCRSELLLCHDHYISSGVAHLGCFPASLGGSCSHKDELTVRLNFLPFVLKRSGGGQPGSLDRWESLFVPSPSTMALQQAQMLLSMNSLESVNAGVQQNNTESFAVALCHLAELHAEQVGGGQVGGLLGQGRLCQFFPVVLEKGTGHVRDKSG